MGMLFTVDIDGTVARHESGEKSLICYMNRELGLGISAARLAEFRCCSQTPNSELQTLMTYSEEVRVEYEAYSRQYTLKGSSEVQTWLAQSEQHKKRYEEVLYASQFDPDIQKAKVPMPGAIQAMHRLALLGKIIYVTLRKPYSEQLTREWLAWYGFPSPDQAYCCEHFEFKYLEAYHHLQDSESLTMIDDNIRGLIGRFPTLARTHVDVARSLLHRISFVLIGNQVLDPIPEKFQRFSIARIPTFTSEQFERWYEEVSHELARQNAFRRRE
jgi:hypothetical protein